MSDSKQDACPQPPDPGLRGAGNPQGAPMSAGESPRHAGLGAALTTRLDWASEPQEPREGFEERSVLEGLRGIFHKLFIEMHNMQT